MSSIMGTRFSFSALTTRLGVLFGMTVCVLVFSVPGFSQGSNGRILGTVKDQSGGVIAGSTVTIIDKDRGVARTLTTDNAGEYDAPQLLPGTYLVRGEANGFKRLEREGVELGVGKEVRVDLTLQPGAQAQTVTVTESLPLIETTNATLGGTLQNAAINDLPLNGRNFQSLMGLRPGVMLQPGGSPWTQSTNNIRPDETSWLVDGILNANAFDARPVAGASAPFTDGATILPVDAIQEFNLEENPKAEFGGKPGAVVNVGIRSGTNNFHGTAYAFGRDGTWDAKNRYSPGQALPLQLEQFGGAVGGPIKKDKLFFFANYEGLRDQIASALSSSVPATAAGLGPASSMVDAILGLQSAGVPVSPLSKILLGCPSGTLTAASTCTGGLIQGASPTTTTYVSSFPNTNQTDNGIAKINYRISDKHMINGMIYKADYLGLGEDFPMVNSAWLNDVPEISWTTSGNWVWTASSRLVNELRVGYNRFEFKFLPHDAGQLANGSYSLNGVTYPINTGLTSTGGFPSINIGGFAQLGSRRGRPLEASPNPYYDVQDNVSYLVGKHSFKFGGEFSHIEGDSNPHDTRGRVQFSGGQAFKGSSALEDFFAGDATRAFLLSGNPSIKAISKVYGVFGQDDWRLTSKLIVNLGLRWEYRTPFHEVNNLLGGFNPTLGLVQQGQSSLGNYVWKPDHKNFSPRLGFAYDVSGKGTTVVRGGLGIFYSMFTLAPFTGNPGIQNVGGGTSIAAVPTGGCTVAVPAGSSCSAQGGTTLSAGGTIATGTLRIPGSKLAWNGVVFPGGGGVSCTAASQCSIGSVDPNLKTPTVFDWNLGVQHAFNNNLSLDISYVGTRGEHLIGAVDLNQVDPLTGLGPYSAKFPYLQFINWTTNDADSNYNSMQATLTERLTHGLSFTVGYTYGHGIDNGSLNRFAPQPENSFAPGAERADSDFDIRNRATITASYEIPGKKGFGQMLEGWKLNSVITLAGAQPWNVMDTNNNWSNTSENTDRWDFFGNPSDFKASSSSIPYCTGPGGVGSGTGCTSTSGISGFITCASGSDVAALGCNGISPAMGSASAMWKQCTSVAPDAGNLATGGCFVEGNSVMVPPKANTFGTMGRNIFRDAGFKNVDFSVFKNFKFTERFSAQFRVEFFNLFNAPIIANPWGSVNGYQGGSDPSSPGTLGCGCATPDFAAGNPIVGSGDSRTMQLGLKLMF